MRRLGREWAVSSLPVLSVAQSAMTQGKQHQAMHQPILTGWWDTVDVSCILPATRPFPW